MLRIHQWLLWPLHLFHNLLFLIGLGIVAILAGQDKLPAVRMDVFPGLAPETSFLQESLQFPYLPRHDAIMTPASWQCTGSRHMGLFELGRPMEMGLNTLQSIKGY